MIDRLKLTNAVEWEWLQKRQSNENLKKTIHSIDYVRSKTMGESLFSLITSDAICICDFKYGIAVVKVTINKKKILHHQNGRKCKEETNEMLHLEHSYVWCWNLYAVEVEQKHLEIFKMCWRGMEEIRWTDHVECVEILHRLRRKEHRAYNKLQKGWLEWSYLV